MSSIEVVTVNTALGDPFKMAIARDDTDAVTLSVRAGMTVMPSSVETLLAGVPRGAAVLDLGANIGTFAVAAAAFGYDVVAVEASAHNANLLHESARLNGFENLRIVSAAISDRVGTIFFQQNGPYGIVNPSATAPPGYDAVAATTVDELVNTTLAGRKVGFVKMDIEGSEVAAVHGMTGLMGGPDAPPIFYESNGHTLNLFGKSPADLVAEFERLGYKSYRAESQRLTPLGSGYVQYPCVVDYLAVKGALTGAWGDYRVAENTPEQQTQLALGEAAHPVSTHRVHLARTMSQAKASVLMEPRIWAALVALKNDTAQEVRQAMAWFTPG